MFAIILFSQIELLAQLETLKLWFGTWWPYAAIAWVALFVLWLGFRYIPNNSAGVVEKLWSPSGSVPEGQIVALEGEAGYQVELLRGGMHFGYWRWQYRVHKVRLVSIPQGKIGYVYARDGEPLPPSQTLGPARCVQQLSRRQGVSRRHRRR